MLKSACTNQLISLANHKNFQIKSTDQIEAYLRLVKVLENKHLEKILNETENENEKEYSSSSSSSSISFSDSFTSKLRYLSALKTKNFNQLKNTTHLTCQLAHENSDLIEFDFEILKNLFFNDFDEFVWLVGNNDKVLNKMVEMEFLGRIEEEYMENNKNNDEKEETTLLPDEKIIFNTKNPPTTNQNLINKIKFLKSYETYQSYEIESKIGNIYKFQSIGKYVNDKQNRNRHDQRGYRADSNNDWMEGIEWNGQAESMASSLDLESLKEFLMAS